MAKGTKPAIEASKPNGRRGIMGLIEQPPVPVAASGLNEGLVYL